MEAGERIRTENDTRKTWTQIFGIFSGIALLYFILKRIEVAQESNITERITRAIDHIGATDSDGNPIVE